MSRMRTGLKDAVEGLKAAAPAVLTLVLLLAILIWNPPFLDAARFRAFDFYQRLQPGKAPASPTLVVDIDDRSLGVVGQWPWDRSVLADLLNRIGQGSPRSVGLDIVFPEQDRQSPAQIRDAWKKKGIDIAELANMPDTDAMLAAAIKSLPSIAAIAAAPVPLSTHPKSASIAAMGLDPRPYLRDYPGAVVSIPILSAAAAGKGSITIEPGSDGVVRQLPMLLKVGKSVIPSISAEMLRVGEGEKTYVVKTDGAGVSDMTFGNISVPLDGAGRIWIRYAGHLPERFVPAIDLLQGKIDPAVFKGRDVILGSSAFGLWDLRATPLGYSMFGSEIQAQVVDDVRAGTLLKRPNWMRAVEIAIVLGAGIFLIGLVHSIGARWTLGVLGIVIAAVASLSWYAFTGPGVLIDPVAPIVSAALVYLILIYTGHAKAEDSRAHVIGAFKRYLSPVLVEKLARRHIDLKLGGETRVITTLFADIQGFTPLSEKLIHDPVKLTTLVNKFLEAMSKAVLDAGGTIDKYMGDNVMAFWNAPLEDPLHGRSACSAALKMQAAMAALNHDLAQDPAWSPYIADGTVKVGIGINTGECVVGNFGSSTRYDYSVIGDAVNLASRLEGAAKRYGGPALITAATKDAAPGIAALPLGEIVVRGRVQGVETFAVVGEDSSDPAFLKLQRLHDVVLEAARGGDPDFASDAAKWCLVLRPDLQTLYIQLLKEQTRPAAGC